MLAQASDTRPEMEAIQISLLRQASVAKKISGLRSLSMTILQLSRRAIVRANPGLSEHEMKCKLVEYHYGEELAECFRGYLEKRAQ
jgi:hypothetical protein